MTTLRRTVTLLILLVAALVAVACGGPGTTPTAEQGAAPTAPPGDITVFAASSLKDAFGQLMTGLEHKGLAKPTYNFAGSQTLVTQLSQGATADIFASADARNMDAAVAAGVVVSGSQRLFATNRLVVITAPGGSAKVSALKDLSTPGLKLVLAAPSVPAGNYSLQILDKLAADPAYATGFKDAVISNVVSREDNVRQVVSKVQLGEADAGIVYITDAQGGKVSKIEIPDKYNVVARYYVAPVKNAPNPGGVAQFINYLLSSDGQDTLRTFGFGTHEGK